MSSNQLCDDAGVTGPVLHYFTSDAGVLHPTSSAGSGWGADMLSGPAVVGLAAWGLESEYGAEGFLPARLTVDLFKAVRTVPTEIRTRLVRGGRRVRNSECDIVQDGVIVARATMVQYRTSAPPPGREWAPPEFIAAFTPPPDTTAGMYLVGSDESLWSGLGGEHQNTARKRVYHRTIDIVAGHRSTPCGRAVVSAEATSLVGNLGTRGIGYINGDLTVAISRLPVGDYIGVQGDSHWSSEGVSVSGSTLFDDIGPFGIGMVTAVANPAAQIDFARFGDSPTLQV